ncbi:hypothetical protein ABK040_015618 [Willaertia magna]
MNNNLNYFENNNTSASPTIITTLESFDSNNNSNSNLHLEEGINNNEYDSDDILLLPFNNAVVYSRTEDHQRHSKYVFECTVIFLCLIPFTMFINTNISIYLFIENLIDLDKTILNYLSSLHFITINIVISSIEFGKSLIIFFFSLLIAFLIKVYTFDTQLTISKKNFTIKLLNYLHYSLKENPICCLFGLMCCIFSTCVLSNILFTFITINLFINNFTNISTFSSNLKISIFINFLDWICFIIYFLLFYKLQQRQKQLKHHHHQEEEEDGSEEYESEEEINNQSLLESNIISIVNGSSNAITTSTSPTATTTLTSTSTSRFNVNQNGGSLTNNFDKTNEMNSESN